MTDLVLHVGTTAVSVDLVSGRLWELGTVAVEERPHPGGAEGAVLLVASFPTPDATRWAAAELAGDATGLATGIDLTVDMVEVDDSEWRDAWKQHAEPVDVGDRLRVVPAWRPDTVDTGRLRMVLDSGACFGSGTHPTTRTVLAVMETLVTPASRVLDVGTGSGILAIAAALLGAASVDAIDIDPESVPVTETNAVANGVGPTIAASTTDLADVPGPYDLVLANVSAGTLTALAGDLMRVAAPAGGTLVLSGMLEGQWRHVRPCFDTLAVVQEDTVEGWTTAVLASLHDPARPGSPAGSRNRPQESGPAPASR